MDGLFHGKPHLKWMIWGVKTPYFWFNIQILIFPGLTGTVTGNLPGFASQPGAVCSEVSNDFSLKNFECV